MIFEKGGREKL